MEVEAGSGAMLMQERRMESGLEFAGGWVRIDGQGREQFAMFDLVFFFSSVRRPSKG